MSKRLESLSNLAGVLGFVLASALAVLQAMEFYREHSTHLRVAEVNAEDASNPFFRHPAVRLPHGPFLVFTVHSEGGSDIRIEAVGLKVRRQFKNSGDLRTTRGFGPEGIWKNGRDATWYFCWQVGPSGDVPKEEVPFSAGETRFYAVPEVGVRSVWKRNQGFKEGHALIEIWSQGRIVGSFDVSDYLNARFSGRLPKERGSRPI